MGMKRNAWDLRGRTINVERPRLCGQCHLWAPPSEFGNVLETSASKLHLYVNGEPPTNGKMRCHCGRWMAGKVPPKQER